MRVADLLGKVHDTVSELGTPFSLSTMRHLSGAATDGGYPAQQGYLALPYRSNRVFVSHLLVLSTTMITLLETWLMQ